MARLFYLHLGVAVFLARMGLTRPIAVWVALFVISLAATWGVARAVDLIRPLFRRPWPWVVLAVSTLGIGLVPGVPPFAVMLVSGILGLLFAGSYLELSDQMLGLRLTGSGIESRPLEPEDRRGYGVKVALVVLVLLAPELVRRLPGPFVTSSANRTLDVPSSGGPRP